MISLTNKSLYIKCGLLSICRFIRGVKVGEEIVIESSLLKQGKSLAFLTVDIKRKEDDKLVATGRHTKHTGS